MMIDYYPSKIFIKQVVNFLKEGTNLFLHLTLLMPLFLLRFFLFLLLLQRLLGPLRMLLEILIPELQEQLVSDFDNFVDIKVVFDVLKVFKDCGEIIVDDDLLA